MFSVVVVTAVAVVAADRVGGGCCGDNRNGGGGGGDNVVGDAGISADVGSCTLAWFQRALTSASSLC